MGGSQNSGGRYGYTGTGVDGVAQTMKKVPGVGSGQYDAHESEFIFDANATQAIGPKLLTDVMEAARAGRVDVNKIREAIGQPVKPQMATGGVMPVGRNTDTGLGIRTGRDDLRFQTPESEIKTGSVDVGNIQPEPLQIDVGNTTVKKDAPSFSGQIDASNMVKTGDLSTPQDINVYENAMEQAIGKLSGVMRGDDRLYQTERDRLAQDLGGAGAAATAAMRQRGASAGMTDEGIEALSRTRQRDVEGNVGQALTDLSVSQQQQAIGAAGQLANISQWGQNFEFMKEKYGDQEGARMASDAASGMTWETFSEKYPNATLEDWERMQKGFEQGVEANKIGLETSRMMLENMKEDKIGSQLISHVDKSMLSDSNYVRSGAWKNDSVAMEYLKGYWKNTGMEGDFDPDNAEHMAWAEKQMNAFSVSQADAGINAIKNTEWYQGLPLEEKERYENEVFPALSMLGAMGGITPRWDEKGNMELVGPDGEIVYPPEKAMEVIQEDERKEKWGDINVPVDEDGNPTVDAGETFVDGGKLYEYQADDSVKEVKYEEGVDSPWSEKAETFLDMMPDSHSAKRIISERAAAIKNNFKDSSIEDKAWYLENVVGNIETGDPLYEALVKLSNPLEIKRETNLKGQPTSEREVFTAIDNNYGLYIEIKEGRTLASNNVSPSQINGRLYTPVAAKNSKAVGNNVTKYTLIDVSSGLEFVMQAANTKDVPQISHPVPSEFNPTHKSGISNWIEYMRDVLDDPDWGKNKGKKDVISYFSDPENVKTYIDWKKQQ